MGRGSYWGQNSGSRKRKGSNEEDADKRQRVDITVLNISQANMSNTEESPRRTGATNALSGCPPSHSRPTSPAQGHMTSQQHAAVTQTGIETSFPGTQAVEGALVPVARDF